jgi:hypothetical protein
MLISPSFSLPESISISVDTSLPVVRWPVVALPPFSSPLPVCPSFIMCLN